MDRRITTLITSVLSLFLSAHCLFSQEAVSVDFRVFGAGLDSFEELFFHDGSEFTPLEFNKTSRSTKVFEYRGEAPITIYTPNPAYKLNAEEIPPYLPLASIQPDRSLENGLLVLVSHSENRKTPMEQRHYKLFLIDDSQGAFPGNSIQIINATGSDLYGQVAEDRIDSPRNSVRSVDYSNYAKTEKSVPIEFAIKTTDGPRLTMSNDIPLPSNRRVVLILMNPRRAGSIRIEVRALIDAIPIPDTED